MPDQSKHTPRRTFRLSDEVMAKVHEIAKKRGDKTATDIIIEGIEALHAIHFGTLPTVQKRNPKNS